MGKFFIILGIIIITIGVIIEFGAKIPFVGRLPGDILISKGNFTLYFPITTGIILSIILSLIFYIFVKILK